VLYICLEGKKGRRKERIVMSLSPTFLLLIDLTRVTGRMRTTDADATAE
jgi:hypothetical protein